jgi:hypothetical protein
MDKIQEASAGSFLKVRNFTNKNTTKIATITGLPGLFATHSNNVNDLFAADAGSRADLRGITIDKGIKRKNLETIALKLSNAVSAHAAMNNDNGLLKRADFNTSAWYNISEEELITQTTIVRDLSLPLATPLAIFNVTPADITTLTAAINTFVAAISDPSLAIDVRKEDTMKVADIIDRTRLHLETKIDIVMRVFEATDATFYKLYKDARAIDTNGSAMAPTVVVAMPENYLKTIYKMPGYEADTLFTFQNTSDSETIFVSLSRIDNEEGSIIIQVPAGETRQRLALNLGNAGEYLIGTNRGTTPGELKIWVEQ